MKTRTLALLPFLLLCAASRLPAENLPEMRPTLTGSGSRSLVNLIDEQSLMKRGQRDAVVMFSCGVNELGFAGAGEFYRGRSDSEKLGRELVERIDHDQFVPPVYHPEAGCGYGEKSAGVELVYEYPPGKGFGPEVVGRILGASFIPGFRSGKIVRSQFTWAATFNLLGRQMKSGLGVLIR